MAFSSYYYRTLVRPFIIVPWCRVKLEEGVFESIVQLHDRGLIAAAVAVVWSREDGDDIPVMWPVVSLHHQLVSSADQRQSIRMVERLGYVLRKSVLVKLFTIIAQSWRFPTRQSCSLSCQLFTIKVNQSKYCKIEGKSVGNVGSPSSRFSE